MKSEFEIIEHNRLEDAKLFIVDLSYRNLHMHKDFELCYVFSGCIEVNTYRKQFVVGANRFVLFNPNQPHEIHARESSWARILSLQVSPRFCSRYFPAISNVEFSVIDISVYIGGEANRELVGAMFQLCDKYFNNAPLNEFMCFSYINRIFHTLLDSVPWTTISQDEKANKKNTGNRLNRILDYIEMHFREKLLLEDIARSEGLSLTYLSHYLKDHLNMPFQDYIALLRFREAKSLLEHTALNVTDVFMACGFSDCRYLNKVFMKQLGCTPGEYRMRNGDRVDTLVEKPSVAHQRFLSFQESLDALRAYRPLSRGI